jgi:hypothetical protein
MDTILISPVALVLTGLIVFILGQFLKSSYRFLLSTVGLVLIALFFYKLLSIKGTSESLSYNLNNKDFNLSFGDIYFLILGINIIGFILWLTVILKIAFTDKFTKDKQQPILIAAGLIMLTNLLIFYVLGSIAGLVCLPVLTISFYIAYKNYVSKLSTKS